MKTVEILLIIFIVLSILLLGTALWLAKDLLKEKVLNYKIKELYTRDMINDLYEENIKEE